MFDAIITIEDPGARNKLRFHNPNPGRHLILVFEDYDSDMDHDHDRLHGRQNGVVLPTQDHLRRAIEFGSPLIKSGSSLLVHCEAGIARSTAVGYCLLLAHLGRQNADMALTQLYNISPTAIPNLRIISLLETMTDHRNGLIPKIYRHETTHKEKLATRKRRAANGNGLQMSYYEAIADLLDDLVNEDISTPTA